MANASYIQDAFTGGEKSQLAQGRINDREYRTWMNICLNGHPTEAGGWVRRAGTMYAGHTRGGGKARVYKFDFAAATPYTMEFSDGFIRFRVGSQIAFTNDAQNVVAISAANPAVVQTGTANGWSTGNTAIFTGAQPLLQNRQFVITVVDSTHFSIADAITLAPINGASLGALPAGTTVSRVQELASPYVGGKWTTLRSVQAEQTAVLLQATLPPQLLTVTTQPATGKFAQFGLGALTFLDGPYLDPFTNGAQATPTALSGNITLSVSFPQWSATQAYETGQFVTSASVNYESLIDNNVSNAPASSPTAWQPISAGAAINNGQGFLGTDVGRLVRLFSEPPLWNGGTSYIQGSVVSYNPTGQPGASTYWTSGVGPNVGNIPGLNTTTWVLTPANAAIWTWGKITSLANQVPQNAGLLFGTMTQGGGLFSAFDGVVNESQAASASFGFVTAASSASIDCNVGKDFVSPPQVPSPRQISSVTVYSPIDSNFLTTIIDSGTGNPPTITQINMVINLRASQTNPSLGISTLLGSTGNIAGPLVQDVGIQYEIGGGGGAARALSIQSNDQVTAWNFVWVEFILQVATSDSTIVEALATVAEVQFYSPPGTGSGNAANVEILGAPLLYTNPIITWRLGAYSNTTGWPTNGTYHEGRVWLGGAIGNRFDASVSNGLSGNTLNMAPTDQNGVVGAANALDEVLNSDGVNPIFWMVPDLQGIIMGTQDGEWLISAPSTGPISATNIFAHRVTRIGCAFVEPRKTDHTNVFVQRYAKKVMEYFTDVYSGKFSAPNLSKDTMHITKPLVAELAYTQANIPLIWGRNNDGSWWGATYKRDTLATSTGPTINGWHRHLLGSGRTVQSIAAGPSVGGALDALSMVTVDPVTGIFHVEVMTDAVDEGDTLIDATYLDDAVNPTSTTTSNVSPAPYGGLTINGLWHLNGKTVTAWLGGLDCGDYAVANGTITVPYGDGISAGTANGLFTAGLAASLTLSEMLVGFTFTSQGQIVRPATPQESGARNGPAVGKVRRNHKIAAQFEGTGVGVSVGTTFPKVDPVKFRQPNDTSFLVNQQFTGVYKDTLTDTFSLDGMVCWQITRPYPCNIANLGGFIETSDE